LNFEEEGEARKEFGEGKVGRGCWFGVVGWLPRFEEFPLKCD
jgi:hypothetical protein